MKYYSFTIVLSPIAREIHEIEDALYESGCDDALLSFRGSTPFLDFDRAAGTLSDAAFTAIRDVQNAKIEAEIIRIWPDDLVNASEISSRGKVTREAVRLWINGDRGEGNFPRPVAQVGKSMIWSWLEVAEWLHNRGILDKDMVDEARFFAALNIFLGRKRVPSLNRQLKSIEKEIGKKACA